MDARMCECARESDGRCSLPVQLPVAAKVPAVQSPGLTHVYPVEAVISHVVPSATFVAPDTQLVPLHEPTPSLIVGTVQTAKKGEQNRMCVHGWIDVTDGRTDE